MITIQKSNTQISAIFLATKVYELPKYLPKTTEEWFH